MKHNFTSLFQRCSFELNHHFLQLYKYPTIPKANMASWNHQFLDMQELNMTAFKFSVIDAFGKLRLGCLVWSWTKTITGLSISAQLQDFCLGPNLLRFDLCQNILRYVLHQVMPAVRSAFKTWSVSCDSSMLQFVLYACFIKSWEKHFVSSWKRKLRVCSAGQSSGLSHDAFDVVQPCQKMQVLVGTTWRVSTASASQGEFFL